MTSIPSHRSPPPPQAAAIAAFTASGVNVLATYPFDTLNKAMQRNPTYAYPQAFQYVLRTSEGALRPRNFYRGLAPALLESGLGRALLFSSVESIKRLLPAQWFETSREVVATVIFSGIRSTLVAPLERIKAIMQVDKNYATRSTFGCAKQLVREEGVMALWRGGAPNALRNFIRQPAYMGLRRYLTDLAQEKNATQSAPKFAVDMAIGSVSATAGEIVSYPLLTTMLRVQQSHQLNNGPKLGLGYTTRYAWYMWQSHGLRAFYNGLSLRIGGYIVGGALLNVGYEFMLERLNPKT